MPNISLKLLFGIYFVYLQYGLQTDYSKLQTETGAVLGFDGVAKVMLACSALFGEHLK